MASWHVTCAALLLALLMPFAHSETHMVKMQGAPIVKTNPSGCDEFIIPKNYKQVMLHVDMVTNSKILFSNLSKKDQICPDDGPVTQDVNVGDICEDDISCTMFERVDFAFRFRAEQCAETLYVLMIYPEVNEDPAEEMSISAEYIDSAPCFTVTGGIHEIANTETQCGERSVENCESTIRCALVTCKYPLDTPRNETVCLPRGFSQSNREDYCAKSGLILVGYGSLPLDEFGTLTIILFAAGGFLLTCCCAGCYYNYRIYQNKRAPFSVPKFCPQCCFPQPKDTYEYSFDDANGSEHSFDVLDANQVRNSTRRGTTKYRAPQFYFEDD